MSATRDATLERLLADLCRRDPLAVGALLGLARAGAESSEPARRTLANELASRWLEAVAADVLDFLRQSEALRREIARGTAPEFWSEAPGDAERLRAMRAREFETPAMQSPLGELARDEGESEAVA